MNATASQQALLYLTISQAWNGDNKELITFGSVVKCLRFIINSPATPLLARRAQLLLDDIVANCSSPSVPADTSTSTPTSTPKRR